MKKLIVIGASLAALAIAAWFLRSPPAGDAGIAKSPELASPLLPPRDARESAEAAPAAQPSEPVALAPARESARAPSARPAPTEEPASQPTAARTIDEQQQLAPCRALWERERKAEQAARAAETKDLAWAYATEQKLHEYLSRRLRTSPIEVTRIDCKATFCEITGQGFVPEGDGEFRLALEAVSRESWSDFTGSSSSQYVQAGKVIYTGEVRRQQSYATALKQQPASPEEIACMTRVGRQHQREHAIRDAQPKDTGWADQMEQLLRMHLMAQLTKHPPEQLDIHCRTTICLVKAKGRSNDALLALKRAMTAVDSEPWANLRNGQHGSSGYESWTAEFTLHRR
jgi:hypothetical protein